ncbi:ASP-6 protein [Aphelenchoides avenae]|nr:ASP-6 protein [Aphelenchus avenae]
MGTDDSALIVPNTTFGQAYIIADFFRGDPIDGILGLAFQSNAVDGVQPVLIEAYNNGILDQPLFTAYLKEKGAFAAGVNGGVYTYGAIDTENCGPIIAYQPLSSAMYYQFEATKFSFGSFSTSGSWQVISDTGTSLIGGPQGITDAIAALVNGQFDDKNGVYWIDCNVQFGPFTVTIGGNDYAIDRKQLVSQEPTGCILGITPQEAINGVQWILGDPFVRQYCNIYDFGNKRIGFAKAKQS